MKNRSKALLLALCALMLVVTTVFTTLAYLTDTKSVVNTFTVGDVEITLTESVTNLYGEKTEGTITAGIATEGNEYKLVPNKSYVKDPKITVVAGSEAAFVYVKVVNDIAALEADDDNTIADQMAAKGWTQLVVDEANVPNVYVKAAAVNASEGAVEVPVFDTVTIAGDADLSSVTGDETITVTAYAIQAEGFADAAAAWKAASGELGA